MNYKVLKRNQLADAEGYRLAVIRPEDIESIRIWRNGQIDVLRQKKPITEEEQKSYFDQQIWPTLTQHEPKQILFSLFYKDQLIGYGGLTGIDWEAKRGEISFLVNPERIKNEQIYRQDYTHFLRLLSRMAFEDLNFHRLFTETFEFRKKHMAILEAFGFKPEGVMREHVFKQGRWHHSIFHGLLKQEYKDGQ